MLIETINETLTHNVLWLCDGGEIEAESLNLLQMFNRSTND